MINLFYERDPIKYQPTPASITTGDGLVSKGLMMLIRARTADAGNMPNVRKSINKVLNGYACLYGLSVGQMDRHVFRTHYQRTADNITRQIRVLKGLGRMLSTVHSFKTKAQLKASPYDQLVHYDLIKKRTKIAEALHRHRRLLLSRLCDSKEHVFTGTYLRSGISLRYMEPTMLISNLKYKGQVVTDHLWVVYDEPLRKMGRLKKDYKIKIAAKVKPYRKYKQAYSHSITCLDYGITHVDQAMLLVPYYMSSPVPLPDDSDTMAGEIMFRHRKLTHYMHTSAFDIESYLRWRDQLRIKASQA